MTSDGSGAGRGVQSLGFIVKVALRTYDRGSWWGLATWQSLSFKDFGQQVLISLLDYLARRSGRKVSVVVATTGDTGPAAISAAAHLSSTQMVVVYPLGQVSRIQELQMTTEQAENVKVFAFEGGGDDMDAPIKALSTDAAFQQKHGLTSVNSINIGRVLTQTVHYFWSYLRAIEKKNLKIGAPMQFALPCGALGNATAGLMAKLMGLPVSNILCGTNDNDIFHRAVAHGDFSRANSMLRTMSEAINIQVPYNFERMIYLLRSRLPPAPAGLYTLTSPTLPCRREQKGKDEEGGEGIAVVNAQLLVPLLIALRRRVSEGAALFGAGATWS